MLVARTSLMISERDSTLAAVRLSSVTSLDLLRKREFQSLESLPRFLFWKLVAVCRAIVGRGLSQRTPKFTLWWIRSVQFVCN